MSGCFDCFDYAFRHTLQFADELRNQLDRQKEKASWQDGYRPKYSDEIMNQLREYRGPGGLCRGDDEGNRMALF